MQYTILLTTSPPVNFNARGGIYREKAALGRVKRGQADLGVDVEETLEAAGRPDGALNAELVGLEVVVIKGALDGQGACDLLFCSLVKRRLKNWERT